MKLQEEKHRHANVMKFVERYMKENPGTLVRATDFPRLSAGAVSKALSRLEATGQLQRVSKGVYYAPKQTLLGRSRPQTSTLVEKALPGRVRVSGVTAANLLGLSTQVAARPELVVYSQTQLADSSMRLKRRSGSTGKSARLSQEDAAILEVLRDRGRYSELSNEGTVRRVLAVLNGSAAGKAQSMNERRLHMLVESALAEPPRVRAMLGALLENLNASKRSLHALKESLNPLSRFDFGAFRALSNAKEWQAK